MSTTGDPVRNVEHSGNRAGCLDAERLWAACEDAAKLYRLVNEKQFVSFSERDFAFSRYDHEIRAARERLRIAKLAIGNHIRLHGCARVRSAIAGRSR
jgi:hypothetical protein